MLGQPVWISPGRILRSTVTIGEALDGIFPERGSCTVTEPDAAVMRTRQSTARIIPGFSCFSDPRTCRRGVAGNGEAMADLRENGLPGGDHQSVSNGS